MEKKYNALSMAIHKSVLESMENMIFQAVEPMRLIWGKVQIIRPCSGAITVAFPEKLVMQFVGELHVPPADGQQSTAIFMDTVAEITNTIAGRMMNLLVPDEQEFEIGLPKTGSGDIEYKSEAVYIQHFEIEGCMYAVIVEGRELLDHRLRPVEQTQGLGAAGWGN